MFENWISAPMDRTPALFLSITMHTVIVALLLQTHTVIRNSNLHMQVVRTGTDEPLWLPLAPPIQPRTTSDRKEVRRTSLPPNVGLFTPDEHLTAAVEGVPQSVDSSDPSLNLVPELNISQEVLQTRLETIPRLFTDSPDISPPPPSPPTIETNTAQPPPVRIGGQVEPAQLIKQVVPVYPPMAKNARVQGVVVVDAIIQPSGKLTELKVLDGHPLLIDAALAALRQWRYKPAKLNGTPVDSPVHINVTFRLVFQ